MGVRHGARSVAVILALRHGLAACPIEGSLAEPSGRLYRGGFGFLARWGPELVAQVTPIQVGDIELLVETVPVAGSEEISRVDEAIGRAGAAFSQAQAAIVEVATSIVAVIEETAVKAARPDSLVVEFGLEFSAKGNVIIAGASGGATLKVTLTYSRNVVEADRSGQAATGPAASG